MTMYLPARILVAPSGFKESLSAVEVAESIAAGVRRVLPGVRVDLYPVPDGGEGTVEILADRPGAVTHAAQVTGPVGQQVQATWLEFPDQGVAVMEMASAAGLSLVPRELRDPTATTTYGVGQLLAEILDHGVQRIVVGCGDSGTSDGGAGACAHLAPGFSTRTARSLSTVAPPSPRPPTSTFPGCTPASPRWISSWPAISITF